MKQIKLVALATLIGPALSHASFGCSESANPGGAGDAGGAGTSGAAGTTPDASSAVLDATPLDTGQEAAQPLAPGTVGISAADYMMTKWPELDYRAADCTGPANCFSMNFVTVPAGEARKSNGDLSIKPDGRTPSRGGGHWQRGSGPVRRRESLSRSIFVT